MSKQFKCVCDPPLPSTELSIQCSLCLTHQHQLCVQNAVFLTKYECPSCQMSRANPALEILEYVVPLRKIDAIPVMIKNTGDLGETKVFVRCLKLCREGHCTEWPPLATIKLNGQVTSKGTNKVEITDITADMPGPSEELKIEFLADSSSEYLWSVVKVRRRTADEIHNLLDIWPEAREESLRMLFEGLDTGKKEVKVEILPLRNKSLLPHPVRGYWCTHYKCFDLKQFVEERVMKRTPDWKCPICGKSCYLFKFDRVQNQFQTQFSSAASIYLTRNSASIPAISHPDHKPRKRPKLLSEPRQLMTFDDFIGGERYVGRVSDAELWGPTGLEAVWGEFDRQPQPCICDNSEIQLEEGEFSITKVDIPIELD